MHHVNIVPPVNLTERKHHETSSNWRRWRQTETRQDRYPTIAEEKMNDWRSRLVVLAIMLVLPQLHSLVLGDVPNTDEGMALFHVSAMLCDLAILWCAPRFISGRLRDDTQTLCLVSVVANYIGFRAYVAYAPPIYYDTFMWGLSYVQWARLLLVGRHADFSGLNVDPDHFGHWRSQNIGRTTS